jgi:hypothetical protein
MKCDGENNHLGLMETEDGALLESEQEPAEGGIMMVDEVFSENNSQELSRFRKYNLIEIHWVSVRTAVCIFQSCGQKSQ